MQVGVRSLEFGVWERFEAVLFSLLSNSEARTPNLAIALSGGSDSMALALLTQQNGLPMITLTVNHDLRPESAAEAAQVAAWMQARSIAHHTLHWQHEGIDSLTGNLQHQARKARYRLLTDFCRAQGISHLLLGHTEDDQAETIATMRIRGAGSIGLSGMSAKREINGVTLLRPLLAHSRQELRDWLNSHGQPWVDDPSNENDDFLRIRLRREFAANPQRRAHMLALGRENAVLRQRIEQQHAAFIHQYVTAEHGALTVNLPALLALNEAQAAYSLGRMLCHLSGRDYPPRHAELTRALTQLAATECRPMTLGKCLLRRTKADLLHLQREAGCAPESLAENLPKNLAVKPLVPLPFFPIFSEV